MALLTPDAHRDRHRWLQHALDELLQDYLLHAVGDPDQLLHLPIGELLTWARVQANQPTEPAKASHLDGILLYAWVDDATHAPVPIAATAMGVRDQALLMTAATAAVLDQPHVREALERHARSFGRSVRLVRCVEVETLRAVAPDQGGS